MLRRKIRKIIFKKSQNIIYRYKLKYYLIIILLTFSLFVYINQLKRIQVNKIVYLNIPQISQIYLPDILELPTLEESVLGAQNIEPTDIVKFVNIQREKVGSPALRTSISLMKAAQLRADVILKYQNFSHQDPYENIELGTVLPKIGYHFIYASENIGMGGVSAENFVDGFMNSGSHRENLLNPRLTDTGIAIVTGPYKQYYVNIAVQLFTIPAGKEEYLGYSEAEKEKYKQMLNDLTLQLNPVNWMVYKFINQKEYTNDKKNKLELRRQILETIFNQMKNDIPLTNDHVALIMKFNNIN